MSERRPFSIATAADHLGCSPSHVRNLCARGALRHFRIGRLIRIPASAIDVSPHVLRHSAAVHMVEAGVPMSEIARYLGHSSEATTFKVYAVHSPGYLKRAASALE